MIRVACDQNAGDVSIYLSTPCLACELAVRSSGFRSLETGVLNEPTREEDEEQEAWFGFPESWVCGTQREREVYCKFGPESRLEGANESRSRSFTKLF